MHGQEKTSSRSRTMLCRIKANSVRGQKRVSKHTRTKKIWFNEPTNKKTAPAGFGVSFSGKDAKCNKIISSLTEPWKPIRPKKKKQFTPGSPRRKRGESKFAGAKATAHPAQANALDKLHQHQHHHQHHQHHHHHQQFQKGKHAPKCRPKRKKPPPVPKSQANPNLRPKTVSVPCPEECS